MYLSRNQRVGYEGELYAQYRIDRLGYDCQMKLKREFMLNKVGEHTIVSSRVIYVTKVKSGVVVTLDNNSCLTFEKQQATQFMKQFYAANGDSYV